MEKFPFFMYRGHSSLEYGLFITKKNVYKGAQRDLKFVSVPGRNGDLIIDNGRYKNITVTYKLALLNNTKWSFSELAHLIKSWLFPEQGYSRLWDSYNSGYFRQALYSDELDIEEEIKDLGAVTISFNCKPFMYSFDGQNVVDMTACDTLYNAEAFPALPYIKITGSGAVKLNINENELLIGDLNEFIELDFETLNAYKGSEPKNNTVFGSLMSSVRLMPGFNTVSCSGNVSKLEIIPRWCRL